MGHQEQSFPESMKPSSDSVRSDAAHSSQASIPSETLAPISIDYVESPDLFVCMRNSMALNALLTAHVENDFKARRSLFGALKDALDNGTASAPEIDYLRVEFENAGLSLTEVLIDGMNRSGSTIERILYLKYLVALGDYETFVDDFMVPALTGRQGRVTHRADRAWSFAIEVFEKMDRKEQSRLLLTMDMPKIPFFEQDLERFGQRLNAISKEHALPMLASKLSLQLEARSPDDEQVLKLMTIARAAAIGLEKDILDREKALRKQSKSCEPFSEELVRAIQDFYLASLDFPSCGPFARLLAYDDPKGAARFFFQIASRDSDYQSDGGIRFRAVSHFVQTSRGAPSLVSALESMIQDERDPIVLGHLCLLLGSECGDDGCGALASVISHEIGRGGEGGAFPIFTTTAHIALHHSIHDVFLRLLSTAMNASALEKALIGLGATEVSAAYPNADGTVGFSTAPTRTSSITTDLVRAIGFPVLSRWLNRPIRTLRENTTAFLACAAAHDRTLFLKAVLAESTLRCNRYLLPAIHQAIGLSSGATSEIMGANERMAEPDGSQPPEP